MVSFLECRCRGRCLAKVLRTTKKPIITAAASTNKHFLRVFFRFSVCSPLFLCLFSFQPLPFSLPFVVLLHLRDGRLRWDDNRFFSPNVSDHRSETIGRVFVVGAQSDHISECPLRLHKLVLLLGSESLCITAGKVRFFLHAFQPFGPTSVLGSASMRRRYRSAAPSQSSLFSNWPISEWTVSSINAR